MTRGRPACSSKQRRHNTRQRDSVLKLRVASNCHDWATRLRIIAMRSQEVIADTEHAGGPAHRQILEELGRTIGLSQAEIEAAPPLATTRFAWAAWDGLMSHRHWLEGIVGNTCDEVLDRYRRRGDCAES